MTTATSIFAQRDRLGSIKKWDPQVQRSPNNGLQLFAPRSITVKSKNATASSGPELRRKIKFDESEKYEYNAKNNLIDESIRVVPVDDEQEYEEDEEKLVNASSYRSTTSSDATPNSITDELTNVPEPDEVQIPLRNILNEDEEERKLLVKQKPLQKATTEETNDNMKPIQMENKSLPSVASSSGTYQNGNSVTASNSNGFMKSSNGTTSISNGLPSRKRLLSDRGEQERKFPIMDQKIYTCWNGCTAVNRDRDCGVGLYNPLNNCFLNSVLQAVVHTIQLSRLIIESRDARICTSNNQQTGCFHCALGRHIVNVLNVNNPTTTHWINPFLKRIFPNHRPGTQEDAHEMLTLLLGALEPISKPANNLKINGMHGSLANTPIEQIFGGLLRNRILCEECEHEHINYERIREINLGLARSGASSVVDLIRDFFGKERIQNFACTRCKQMRSAIRHTSIIRSPAVLIVQIKRFNMYGGKNRLCVKPNEVIHLDKYSPDEDPIVYKLNGVIEHIGGSLNYGHYVCAMRGFKGNNWYHFDDSEKRRVSDAHVYFKMEPYILFYTKCTTPASINAPQRRSGPDFLPPNAKQQRRYPPSCYGNRMMNSTFGSFTCSNRY